MQRRLIFSRRFLFIATTFIGLTCHRQVYRLWLLLLLLLLLSLLKHIVIIKRKRRENINLPTYLPTYGSTALLDLGRFFSFLILHAVGRTPWTGDHPVARPLPTHRTAQTQNKGTHISMPRVGFQSTTPVFERAKTFHSLDRAATADVAHRRQKSGKQSQIYAVQWDVAI
jgi:hypothetical protein